MSAGQEIDGGGGGAYTSERDGIVALLGSVEEFNGV